MKLMKFKLLFLIAIMMQSVFSLKAQDDCGGKLLQAQKLYKQGIIEEIPGMLKPCIESGFTRIQRNEAYKILILTYLFDGNQLEAENTMIEFLKKNPEYEVMPNDPDEFVSLFESFRTLSVFSFGLKFGTNFTNPRVIEPYTAGNIYSTKSKNITGGGYHFGVSLNRYIARNIFLNFGINYVHSSYKFVDDFTIDISNENSDIIQLDKFTVELKEYINSYEFPFSVGYEFEYGGLNYFLRTGFSYCMVSNASAVPTKDVIGAKISMTDFRKSGIFFYHFGVGAKYKVPRGYLVMDIRYQYGLNNIVKVDRRYENPELLQKYSYLDDDYALTSLSLSFGYYFSFYQPKKR